MSSTVNDSPQRQSGLPNANQWAWRTPEVSTVRVSTADLQGDPHATRLTLAESLSVLAAPGTSDALTMNDARTALLSGTDLYVLRDGIPLLLPQRLLPFFSQRLSVPLSLAHDPFLQYYLLASIKQAGEINASSDDVHYQRHLARMRDLCRAGQGLVLDVGCDDPAVGAALLPPHCSYLGLDPFCYEKKSFRLVGVGEYLPIRSGSVDTVMFNTSLDHILDWRRAIDEAYRVLVPGGRLLLCSLVWTARAELERDAVHFHHFREYELVGGLAGFNVNALRRYDYKEDRHRHGLYLLASKPNRP